MELNNNQLELLQNYCSRTVQNNQEIHPSDMPQVVSMFRLLAEKGYVITEPQVNVICDSLHSLANKDIPTSDDLRDYLQSVAEIYWFQVNGPKEGNFKRNILKIADDIVSERDIEYSEE